eukprot:5548103-Prymnesium_polylepis.1
MVICRLSGFSSAETDVSETTTRARRDADNSLDAKQSSVEVTYSRPTRPRLLPASSSRHESTSSSTSALA